MDTWVWLLIAAGAVVVVAGLVWMAVRRRRSKKLHERFGDEYDRTLEHADRRKDAEIDLRDRVREHHKLDIKPLSPAACTWYAEDWRMIQTRFVDQPETALNEADALLTKVMEVRGYPVDDFEAKAALVSVDHPDVVENYRFAHDVHVRNKDQRASTEELREAFLRYRSLFDELLVSEDQPSESAGRR